MNENDANLINAIDFINETKQLEEENQKPQPTEITIIEKRSLRTKILLICGIVFLSAALIATSRLYWVCNSIIYLDNRF